MTMPRFHWSAILEHRMVASICLGVIVFFLLPRWMTDASRLSVAWIVCVAAQLAVVFRTVGRRNSAEVRVWAERADLTGFAFPVFLLFSAAASVMASVFVLRAADGEVELARLFHLLLGASTVILTWFGIQAAFAVRYAKMYYGNLNVAGEPGLRFPDDPAPDFYDFLYFATCAGMTFEASDVAVVSKRFRHWLTFHATFSFVFASINLALLVDIAANLI